jgi:hypothetical protein
MLPASTIAMKSRSWLIRIVIVIGYRAEAPSILRRSPSVCFTPSR